MDGLLLVNVYQNVVEVIMQCFTSPAHMNLNWAIHGLGTDQQHMTAMTKIKNSGAFSG